jgi:4-diphosphocytidyl-2-C-methyl-D-erythritol kinase
VELALRDAPGVALHLEGGGPDVPADERNLAHRAARAFLERAGARGGVSIHLAKRVPSGAGLGGGASDAGAVLRGLTVLLPGALAPDVLARVALGLGADVPFFLDPRPARVGGVGERVEPEAGIPELPLIVAHPGISLATAAVYRAFDEAGGALTEGAPIPTFRPLPARPGALEAAAWEERVRNDLEPAATRLCPSIGALRAALGAAGALAVGLSGSGSAVYGVFASEEERDRAMAGLRLAAPARAFATATLASPSAPGARGLG